MVKLNYIFKIIGVCKNMFLYLYEIQITISHITSNKHLVVLEVGGIPSRRFIDSVRMWKLRGLDWTRNLFFWRRIGLRGGGWSIIK